jgi:hypothetical protein
MHREGLLHQFACQRARFVSMNVDFDEVACAVASKRNAAGSNRSWITSDIHD